MSQHSYEVEIKSLLKGKNEAEKLVEKMRQLDPSLASLGSHKQLNHYFVGGDIKKLFKKAEMFVEKKDRKKFKLITDKARDYSLRTRLADGEVFLVIKASVDDTTSANGIARIEFEAKTPKLTLEELDKIVIDSGFKYQAKWSRERAEYKFLGIDVSIDKNAGYGYLAEFEIVEKNEARLEETKSRLRNLLRVLEIEELEQPKLERMFAFYNAHWQDYYGTDKFFIIE